MKLSSLALPTLDDDAFRALLEASHGDPFALLGMHQADEHLVVRVFRPDSRQITVRRIDGQPGEWPAVRVNAGGFFEAVLEGTDERFRYELAFIGHDGTAWTTRDPYSFGTILGPLDLHPVSYTHLTLPTNREV